MSNELVDDKICKWKRSKYFFEVFSTSCGMGTNRNKVPQKCPNCDGEIQVIEYDTHKFDELESLKIECKCGNKFEAKVNIEDGVSYINKCMYCALQSKDAEIKRLKDEKELMLDELKKKINKLEWYPNPYNDEMLEREEVLEILTTIKNKYKETN